MEKDACAMRVPTPKVPEKNGFTSADSCGYRACCQVLSRPIRGREILVMLTTLFQALQPGFWVGDSVIARTADLALCSFSYDT